MHRSLIFDIGANRGQNIAYYLLKADLVVAVEPNPHLALKIRELFHEEIQNGKLVLEEVVLTSHKYNEDVPFYIHMAKDVLSTFLEPADKSNFIETWLPSKSVSQLLEEYGCPDFAKIDVENYDAELAEALFAAGCTPTEISIEAHNHKALDTLLSETGYRGFRVVRGAEVQRRFHKHYVHSHGKKVSFGFPHHAAGPFGEDLPDKWLGRRSLSRIIRVDGLGWIDIHASTRDQGIELNPLLHTIGLILRRVKSQIFVRALNSARFRSRRLLKL